MTGIIKLYYICSRQTHNTMPIIVSLSHTHRKYWFADYDDARKFYYLFDGEFAYAIGGYTVTI